MLIWSLSNEWVALFWIQRAGQFILDQSWCLLRLSQQLLTQSASAQSADKASASDTHLSQQGGEEKIYTNLTHFVFVFLFLHSCSICLAAQASSRWPRVEGKRWRRRRPSPPPPSPPRPAPTPPTWPARAPERRTRPSPSWRTSSWTSWTKYRVSRFAVISQWVIWRDETGRATSLIVKFIHLNYLFLVKKMPKLFIAPVFLSFFSLPETQS